MTEVEQISNSVFSTVPLYLFCGRLSFGVITDCLFSLLNDGTILSPRMEVYHLSVQRSRPLEQVHSVTLADNIFIYKVE